MLQPILRNDDMTETTSTAPVTIKKYANRRLYNTATSSYVTLEDLSQMIKDGTDFAVYDARSGEEITRSVLTQIIVEEESKSGQQNLLPVSFLRQLISFYGDGMLQWMVPKYLEHSMDTFSNNQDQIRSYFQNTFGSMFPFGSALEEMGKQNVAMFERVMGLFSPYGGLPGMTPSSESPPSSSSSASASSSSSEDDCDDTASSASASDSSASSVSASSKASFSQTAPSSTVPVSKQETPVATVSTFRSRESASATPSVTPVSSVTPVEPIAPSEPVVSPVASSPSPAPASQPTSTPMPHVQSAVSASTSPTADDMQQKIANLQRQLADLAKNRG